MKYLPSSLVMELKWLLEFSSELHHLWLQDVERDQIAACSCCWLLLLLLLLLCIACWKDVDKTREKKNKKAKRVLAAKIHALYISSLINSQLSDLENIHQYSLIGRMRQRGRILLNLTPCCGDKYLSSVWYRLPCEGGDGGHFVSAQSISRNEVALHL